MGGGQTFLVFALIWGLAIDARAIPTPKDKSRAGTADAPAAADAKAPAKDDARTKEIEKLRVESVRLRAQAQEIATKASNAQALFKKHLDRLTRVAGAAGNQVWIIPKETTKTGHAITVTDPTAIDGPSETAKLDEAKLDGAKRIAQLLALQPLRSQRLRFTDEKELSARALDGLSPADPLPPATKAIADLEKNRKILELLAARDALVKEASLENGDAGLGYGAKRDFFIYDNDPQLIRERFPRANNDAAEVGITFATATWGFFYQKRPGTVAEEPFDDAAALTLAREKLTKSEPKPSSPEAPKETVPAPPPAKQSRWERLFPIAVAQADEGPLPFEKAFPSAVQHIFGIEIVDGGPKKFLAVPNRKVPVTFYEAPTVLASAFQQAYMVSAFLKSPSPQAFPEMKRRAAWARPRRALWAFFSVPEAWAGPAPLFFPVTGDHFDRYQPAPTIPDPVPHQSDKHFYREARDLVLQAHDISGKAARAAKDEFEALVKKYEESSQKANDVAKKADEKAKEQERAKQGKVASTPGASPEDSSQSPQRAAANSASGNRGAGGAGDDGKKDGGAGKKGGGGNQKGGGEGAQAGDRVKFPDIQPANIGQQQPFPGLTFPPQPSEDNSILSQIAGRLGANAALAGLNVDLPPLAGGQFFRGAAGTAPVDRAPASVPKRFVGARAPTAQARDAAGNVVPANGASGAVAVTPPSGPSTPTNTGKGAGSDGGVLNGSYENGIGGNDDGRGGRMKSALTELVGYGAGADGGASENPDGGAATSNVAAKAPGGPEAPIVLGAQLARGGRGVVGILAYVGELKIFTKGKLARRLVRDGAGKIVEPLRDPAVLPPPQVDMASPADAVAQARALVPIDRKL